MPPPHDEEVQWGDWVERANDGQLYFQHREFAAALVVAAESGMDVQYDGLTWRVEMIEDELEQRALSVPGRLF